MKRASQLCLLMSMVFGVVLFLDTASGAAQIWRLQMALAVGAVAFALWARVFAAWQSG